MDELRGILAHAIEVLKQGYEYAVGQQLYANALAIVNLTVLLELVGRGELPALPPEMVADMQPWICREPEHDG